MKDKKKKIEIEREYQPSINRENTEPCRNCRKRDSCFINPWQGKCTGFEAGVPWSIEYNQSLQKTVSSQS